MSLIRLKINFTNTRYTNLLLSFSFHLVQTILCTYSPAYLQMRTGNSSYIFYFIQQFLFMTANLITNYFLLFYSQFILANLYLHLRRYMFKNVTYIYF